MPRKAAAGDVVHDLMIDDLQSKVRQGSGMGQSIWAVIAAFGAYFCMYGFRKPFTSANFTDDALFGMAYKDVLVIAQVLGYMLSKFLGIKFVAEVAPNRRAALLLGLIAAAEAALLFFGLTPPPVNFVWLFLNGVALGMVFGLVLGFLEGRRHTELLAAGLCASFIVADGVMKSVGSWLLEIGVTEYWMPFTAGLLFTAPLGFFVWMLTRIPAPSANDVAARSKRVPMDAADRWRFYGTYGVGLTLLLLVFALITILRSVRADFAPQIWSGLGVERDASVFTRSEMLVGIAVLVACGSVVILRDNRRAFFAALSLAIAGPVIVALALLGLQSGRMSAFAFMVLNGLGLYLPYIVVHTTIFERMIAMTRARANIGYLICLADAFGYLGYVGVLFARNLVQSTPEMLPFFLTLSWSIAVLCIVLLVPCWWYFALHSATRRETENAQPLDKIARLAETGGTP